MYSLRRDWKDVKGIGIGTPKEIYLQVRTRPLPRRGTTDLYFCSGKEHQHTFIVSGKTQARYFSKSLLTLQNSVKHWDVLSGKAVKHRMLQTLWTSWTNLWRTAWIQWVGHPSPFQPFPLIVVDVASCPWGLTWCRVFWAILRKQH